MLTYLVHFFFFGASPGVPTVTSPSGLRADAVRIFPALEARATTLPALEASVTIR